MFVVYPRMYLQWHLGILYSLAYQVKVTLGDLGVCCLSDNVSPVAFRYPVFTRLPCESDSKRRDSGLCFCVCTKSFEH